MSYATDDYYGASAANAPASERVKFIRRTYLHVAGAGVAFVAASAAIIASGLNETLIKSLFASKISWLLLMVVFIGGTFLAEYMAQARKSVATQYAGLALFVALYTLLFVPILSVASKFGADPSLPIKAGIVTLTVFAGLTVAVFLSGKDFSGLGPILCVASFVAFGAILAAAIFGFSLGIIFLALMVALFAGYIIYDTSNIIHRYGTDEHVAASLALFGSAAMLFYYILRIFMITRDE
jgi:uncharacterized protein